MPRYVALLRGINVGGNRRILMAALRETFASAGARVVATYIQSGNVVFSHASRSEFKLCTALEAAIQEATGFAVPVVLRSAAEFANLVQRNPFVDASPEHLHVSFLAQAPAAGALDAFADGRHAPERCVLVDRDLYLCLPNGLGRSQLATALMRHKPVASATSRNWRTVQALLALGSTRRP